MRRTFLRLSDALHPPSVEGHDWKQRGHLYVFRLGCLLCVVCIPAFGVLYRVAEPEAVWDPLWIRGLLALATLGLFAWSFTSAWPRRHVGVVTAVCTYVITSWFTAIAYANAFSANYAVGFFCVYLIGAMLLSMGFERPGPLLAYLGLALGQMVALLLSVPAPGVDPAVFGASLLLAAGLVYVAVSARAQMQAALEERETLLAEAQRTAGLGNWTWEPDTGRVAWSPEMFRLVGLDAAADAPSFEVLAARVHPDDRPALARYWADLFADRRPADLTVRVARPEGGVWAVRIRGALEGGAGRVRLCGVCLDVTPEIERAAALVGAKEQAERAFEQAEAARHEAEAARAEAESARAQAEEMARLKSAFLANMSHEIRTPLTAIIGFAQVLAEEVDEEQQGLVAPIEQGGRRLLDTLNSVLDLARLQAGRFDLRIEPVDTAEEAHALGDLLRPLAQQKGLALVVHAPPNGLVAHADRSALQRVLTNLVSNAVKFTSAGRVTISAEAVGGRIRLRVRDTGRGISPAFLPALFEEFRQESDGLTRSHEGSGLGLAITRQLVELTGGTIQVESELGVGSAFTVTLPRADAPGVPAEAAPEAVAVPA
jgi:signal transduction histidine kinase